jgi:hypothetical protein
MGKSVLFIFLFFSYCCASAQTSSYHPFPDSNAVWREFLTATDGGFGFYQWEEEKFIDGDTVLGGFTYHKIYESGLHMHCYLPCFTSDTLYYYYHQYKGAIRQDTAKRIYTYDINLFQDTLLYDFNLQQGDTIPDSYNHMPASSNPIIVSGIDSVYDGTGYRKKFILSTAGGWPAELIEGIGSTSGLFVELDAYLYEHGGVLRCFIQDDTIRYSDSSQFSCDIIDGLNNLRDEKISVTLSPNPFHDQAKLEFQNAQLYGKEARLRIFNSMGMLVREEITSGDSYILNRDELPEALYFYEMTSYTGLSTAGKFIIR